jgi:hypothetical protein
MRCVIQMHQCLAGPLRQQARSHMSLVRAGDFGPDRIPFVGASLLANAVCHSDASVPDRTPSRASSLPHGALFVAEISVQTEFHLWERACSRMRCVIQMHQCLTGPLREQARSHMGLVCGGDFCPDRIPFVGASLLANAECHPDASVPDTTSSRAGSLPHGPCSWRRFLSRPNSICGSEPARECGVSSRCISA